MTRFEELRAKFAVKKLAEDLANPYTRIGYEAKLKEYGWDDACIVHGLKLFDTIERVSWSETKKKESIAESLSSAKKLFPQGRATQDEF
jgi:aspartyl-tRNA synthetase